MSASTQRERVLHRPRAGTADAAAPTPIAMGPACHGQGLFGRDVTGTAGPDVHVVPLGDIAWHVVPGGYPEQTADEVAADGLPWLTIGAAPDAGHVRPCECHPSVRAVPVGEHTVRVVVHHAHDLRPSGQQP